MTDDLALPFVIERREQLRAICRRAIAGGDVTEAELRSATMKYVCAQGDNPRRVLKRLYLEEGELGSALRKAVAIVSKELDDRERSSVTGAVYPRGDRWYLDEVADPDDIDEDDRDADDDGDIGKANHHASVVADLLVESGRFTDRPAALHHLLHKPAGQALLARMKKAAKSEKESTMNRTEALRDIAKGGILAIAKAMADENRAYGITEHQFTDLIGKHDPRPGESAAQTFSRHFTAQTPDGVILRRAHAVVKASHLEQMFGPTFPAHAKARSEGSAYDELLAKAAEYRKTHSDLSEAQAFAKVFQDPANAALSRRERAESALR
jgi:hypothetical protein